MVEANPNTTATVEEQPIVSDKSETAAQHDDVEMTAAEESKTETVVADPNTRQPHHKDAKKGLSIIDV